MLIFELITPEKIVFQAEVEQVVLPTMDGEITILPNHIPLVTQLVPGVVTLKRGNEYEDVAVSGGFIQVKPKDNHIRVLADTAERGLDLDLETIKKAKERAEKVMSTTMRDNDEAFAQAAAELEKEMARYKVATKYRRKPQSIKIQAIPSDLKDDTGPV